MTGVSRMFVDENIDKIQSGIKFFSGFLLYDRSPSEKTDATGYVKKPRFVRGFFVQSFW